MPKNTTNNMMEDLFSSDQNEKVENHLITTDHPYMASIGLSAFTTGTLYRWWHKKDAEGKYVNQDFFTEKSVQFGGNPFFRTQTPEIILLGSETGSNTDKSSPIGEGQFKFLAWRKEGDSGAGKYVPKYIDGGHTELWDFVQDGENEKGDPRIYNYDDLEIDEFDNAVPKIDDLTRELTLDTQASFLNVDGKGDKEDVPFLGVSPITNAIVLNDYVNHIEFESISMSGWKKKDFARYELINDVQAGKVPRAGLGYVEWSGYVPFYISLGSGDAGDTFRCEKADWVKFKLYLYDNDAPKSSKRSVTLAKPTFAGPPVDALGRKYDFKEDGRFSAFPEGSEASEVVGELDMTYNEYTGKWEAGSQQMVGIISQTIPRANTMTAEALRLLSPEQMLNMPSDPNSHVIFGSGSAIPINMQNGNPMQWTPNYAQASETDQYGKFTIQCPAESDDKATLRVWNASGKELPTDQMCLLNKIDGQWFAIDFPSGIEGKDVAAGFDGKWDFTYFATNFVHYFRDSGFKRIDSFDVAAAFHKKYYDGDNLNSGIKLYRSNTFKMENLIPGGYHQMSSFDFMDKALAGTRDAGDKMGLGITNPVEGPNGETVETDFNGAATGPFFGCIFPDGYSAEDVADYRSARNYVATPTIALSGNVGGGSGWQPIANFTTKDNGTIEMKYFGDGIPADTLPFNNGSGRLDYFEGFRDEENNLVPMFTDEDTSLSQLPADIALNAAPSGKNGQPIKSLHNLAEIYTTNFNAQGTEKQVRAYFTFGQNWLYKKPVDADVFEPNFMLSSAFDFKPRVPNRIMFRPLKAEAYAQFGQKEYDAAAIANGRQVFQQSIAQRMGTRKRAASNISRDREYNIDAYFYGYMFNQATTVPGIGVGNLSTYMGNIYSLYNSHWGLCYNIDIPARPADDPRGFEVPKVGPGLSTYVAPYVVSPKAGFSAGNSTGRFREDSWGRDKNEWGHGNVTEEQAQEGTLPIWVGSSYEPAGGVGVIGAVATATANSNIRFYSQNRLGCWSWAASAGIGNITQYPGWGKGNLYRDLNTTNLFVKIYHQHPRENTIYDPRYFVVHHFNAGIIDEKDSSNNYVVDKVQEKMTQKDPASTTGGTKSYIYEIDQPKYLIDSRIPTAKSILPNDDPVVNVPFELPLQSKVYGTRAKILDGTDYEDVVEFMPKTKWKIDTSRRGKLLPYIATVKQAVIPQTIVTLPDYSDGVNADDEEFIYANGGYAIVWEGATTVIDENGTLVEYKIGVPKAFHDPSKPEGERNRTFDPLTKNEDVLMIVKHPGTEGYKEKDTFVVSDRIGAEFLMEVTMVDGLGRIQGFKVVSKGYDFSYTGFTVVESGRPISNTSVGVSVHAGGSQPTELGKSFNLAIVRAEVEYQFVIDEKPKLATNQEYNRLSIASNAESESTDGPFGLEEGQQEVDVEISEKSDNNKYDLFFHFHNDISHTFMLGDWRGNVSRYPNEENYIDLTITTN